VSQCVAVCYSVFQCIAVMLQCVAVCYSVLQCVAFDMILLQGGIDAVVCCSDVAVMLQ